MGVPDVTICRSEVIAEARSEGRISVPPSQSFFFVLLSFAIPILLSWDHYHRCDLDEEMASKALETSLRQTKRLLWEKYNKPGRNLYEALIAFEHNGVGQKVVCSLFLATPFKLIQLAV